MHFLNKAQALEFLRERADLLDEAGRSNPFACSAWVLNFVQWAADDQWTFVVPEHVGTTRSMMLLHDDPAVRHCRSAATNYYASLYSPLISSVTLQPERRAVLAGLLDQLVGTRPRRASMTFAPLDEFSEDTVSLRELLSSRGWYVKQYFCFGNWYLPCAGLSFDDYMKKRDSKLHNTWVRKSKKFRPGAENSGRLEVVTDPGRVHAAMDAYEQIYAKSWKKPESHPDFVRNWAVICARNGWLRLGLAWVGDVPIAAQFWFTMHGRAYIFKLAYDAEYTKWSAGTVLSAHLFRHAMEVDKVVEIDYLTGDDEYKRLWMTQRRERVGLIACDLRTLRGVAMAASELLGEISRRWRMRVRPPALGALDGA